MQGNASKPRTSASRIVCRVVEAINSPHDIAALAQQDSEINIRLNAWPGAGRRFRGRAALAEALAAAGASFRDLDAQLLEVLELDRDLLVCRIRHTARGATSGARCRSDLVHVVEIRDGLLARWDVFLDERSALAAAAARTLALDVAPAREVA